MKKSSPPKKMSDRERDRRVIADSKAIQGVHFKPNEWSKGILAEIQKEKEEIV